MIDNFELIKPLLSFNSDDEFYFVQVIQRKKDNPGLKGRNNNRLIKPYNIKSLEHLEALRREMIDMADIFNARIGINLNKRSFEKTAFNTLKKIADCMHNKDFKNVRNAWNHACGIHNGVDDKLWLLDVDDVGRKANDLIRFAEDECRPKGNKYITTIPSKNGYHLVIKPFDLSLFMEQYPDVEVHKNNPTNLYCP